MALRQEASQSQNLLGQQIQTLNMLSMNTLELGEYLDELALENPVLEVIHPADISFESYAFGNTNLDESNDFAIENIAAYDYDANSLSSYLKQQIRLRNHSQEEVAILSCLIENLDDDGYLREPLSAINLPANTSLECADRLLSVLQSFEPIGVGARSVKECLLLQLDEDGLAFHIVQECFDSLVKNDVKSIVASLNVSKESIFEALDEIRSLNPYPARGFSYARPEYVLPDLDVVLDDGKVVVEVGGSGSYHVEVDNSYRDLAKRTLDKNAQQWIQGKYQEAYQARSNLRRRQQLLQAVTETIFVLQKAFLYKGSAFLVPLNMSEVAQSLDVSVSTVSRAVKRKYIQCQWGIFPLRAFFPKATNEASVTIDGAKKILSSIVTQEEAGKPLSDQRLVEELAKANVTVSRRTVTRYREELGIPNASQRRYLL